MCCTLPIRRYPAPPIPRYRFWKKFDSRSWSNEGTRPRVEFVDSYEGTAMSAGVIGVTPPSTSLPVMTSRRVIA